MPGTAPLPLSSASSGTTECPITSQLRGARLRLMMRAHEGQVRGAQHELCTLFELAAEQFGVYRDHMPASYVGNVNVARLEQLFKDAKESFATFHKGWDASPEGRRGASPLPELEGFQNFVDARLQDLGVLGCSIPPVSPEAAAALRLVTQAMTSAKEGMPEIIKLRRGRDFSWHAKLG